MNRSLHPDFLKSAQEYDRAAALWKQRFDEIVRGLGQSWLWQTDWIETRSGNGTELRDGNPIFSAICPERRLGIRIVQLEPEADPLEFDFWMDFFAQGEAEEVKELVLSCVLSLETLNIATDLMRQWINDEELELERPSRLPLFTEVTVPQQGYYTYIPLHARRRGRLDALVA